MDDLAVGRSIRAARVRRGWRQDDLADDAGVSRSTVSRVESGRFEAIQVGTVRRVCTSLGIRLLLEARGQGAELDRMLGARHSAMHEAVARLFAGLPDWVALPEVTFAIYGERGAIDILAWHAPSRCLLVIELKTELVDMQDTVATLDRKVRLAPKIAAERGWAPVSVSSWLVIAEGATNRRRVAAHAAMLRSAFPADGRTISRWLRAPNGPVAALSFLSDDRPGNAPSGFAAVQRVPTRR
jgi:transcriptional regulator with XRE-family HTH domain